MENMFAGVIYQNAHGGAPAAYAPPQQYATPPQQYATPPRQYAAPPTQKYSAPPPQSYTASTIPTSTGPRPEQKCYFDGCSRIIRDCPGAADYINRGLCKWDPANNRIVLPNNGWIPRWTTGNNIKEWLDDYYRQNPVHATATPIAIPLAPTTGIKDVLPHMSQNLLEVVENLHAAVSADPNNTDDDEAIIQALQQAQQALEQKKKKQVHFDGVEMPLMRKGKAPDSILKHPDQVGAAKKNQSSAAGPSAPVSRISVSTPVITTTAARHIPTTAVKNPAAADTSGPQYRYSTPVEDPAVVLKVVNCALNVPISITQRELLSISPEVRKQYKELTTTQRVSAGTTEVGKLEEVPNNSPAVYSRCAIHDPDGTDDL
jgi:hypothetical protein